MTLREWFAGQALVGFLASTANPNATGPDSFENSELAASCYKIADAMLAARNEGGSDE